VGVFLNTAVQLNKSWTITSS